MTSYFMAMPGWKSRIWEFHSHMRIIWFSLIYSYAIIWGKISHSFSYVYNMRKFYLRVIHWKSYQKVYVKKFVLVHKVYFIMYVQKFMTKEKQNLISFEQVWQYWKNDITIWLEDNTFWYNFSRVECDSFPLRFQFN
jgi:hypothetical protein